MIAILEDDRCPHCGTTLNAVTAYRSDHDVPREDDLTVCACCGAYLVFDQDLKLRELGESEFSELDEPLRLSLVGALATIRGHSRMN